MLRILFKWLRIIKWVFKILMYFTGAWTGLNVFAFMMCLALGMYFIFIGITKQTSLDILMEVWAFSSIPVLFTIWFDRYFILAKASR